MKKVCLAIGVAHAENLQPLPGAITAAEEIGEWARSSNYDTVETVTDRVQEGPVTIQRLKRVLSEILRDDGEVIDTFVLHFAGHGFRGGAEQNLWLPTDWHSELRVISVEALRARLYRYGIKNLSIFSDACRLLPSDIELAEVTPDAILGLGPYDATPPIIDRYNAVMDGRQAYMLPGDTPDNARCIFSTAAMEALWGHRDDAFDEHLQDKVTPESLALFLQSRLQEIGEKYGLNCRPDSTPGIPRDHLIYFDRNRPPLGNVPSAPKWPSLTRQKEAEAEISPYDGRKIRSWIGSRRLYSPQDFRTSSDFIFKVRKLFPTPHAQYTPACNLIVLGEDVKQVWCAGHSRLVNRRSELKEYKVARGEQAAQVLVEFNDGIFASAVVYERLKTILARTSNNSISWLCVEDLGLPEIDSSLAAGILAQLEEGSLSANQVDVMAAGLREFKHANPTLGAVASYLYDYSGDVDSIRRMAYFYASHHQPIPFDVAFMGLLEMQSNWSDVAVKIPAVKARDASPHNRELPEWVTNRTPEATGRVAGRWPWLTQGWAFVDNPETAESVAATTIQSLSSHLHHSQFTAFTREGGLAAIEIFGMEANQ